jgi:lipopolysaccharide biosynthesis glycosyltransferase
LTPLALNNLAGYTEQHTDGSNQFIYSRFLLPHLTNYQGWAIFMDCDMLARADIAELWDLRDERYAVMVVQNHHDPLESVNIWVQYKLAMNARTGAR